MWLLSVQRKSRRGVERCEVCFPPLGYQSTKAVKTVVPGFEVSMAFVGTESVAEGESTKVPKFGSTLTLLSSSYSLIYRVAMLRHGDTTPCNHPM